MSSSRVRKKQFQNRAGRWLFRLARRYMEGKTALAAERAGERLGRLFFRISRKHRERALANLALAFPEKSEAERKSLAKQVFEHFGRVTTDFLRSAKRNDQEVVDSFEVEGIENFQEAYNRGKGVLLIIAHLGNWERAGQLMKAHGYDLHVVARDADDAELNQDVLDLRESAGLTVLPRGNAAMQILRALKQGKCVALLPDQNSNECFVPFFGKPTGTVTGPAIMSLRSGAPLVPAATVRVGPGKYLARVYPPVEPAPGYDDPTIALTAGVNAAIEAMVRAFPEQYLWFHDRWKSARRRGLV
ncbi:MAG: lysophospholipid acyltransferase family protein [Fimbriimonadaceae bacterium]